jgi:hypothetical protein
MHAHFRSREEMMSASTLRGAVFGDTAELAGSNAFSAPGRESHRLFATLNTRRCPTTGTDDAHRGRRFRSVPVVVRDWFVLFAAPSPAAAPARAAQCIGRLPQLCWGRGCGAVRTQCCLSAQQPPQSLAPLGGEAADALSRRRRISGG